MIRARHAAIVLLCAASIALGACSGGNAQKKDSGPYNKALQARRDGRLGEAEKLAGPLAKDGDLKAQLLLAEVLLLRGQHRRARALLEPVFAKNSEHEQTAALLAKACDGAGDRDRAIAMYARRLRLVPTDKDAAIRVSELLLSKGEAVHAYRFARAALKSHPRDGAILVLVSRAQLARGMLKPSLDSVNAALELDMKHADAWLQLAKVYEVMGEPRKAIESFRRCLGVDAQHAEALFGLGSALVQSREYAQAVGVLERAVKVRPDDPRVLNSYAAALSRAGHHDRAVVAMTRAVEMAPKHPLLMRNLLEVLLDAGMSVQADGLARAAVSVSRSKGVRALDQSALEGAVRRTVVAAAMTRQLCARQADARAVQVAIRSRLELLGLAVTDDEMTRLAAATVPQARAGIKRCRRPKKQQSPPSPKGATP